MTAKDPDNRYISCRELLWDLKSQERRYAGITTMLIREEEKAEDRQAEKIQKMRIDTSLYPGLSKLRNQFPAIFSPDNLLGTMTISESGSLISSEGKFPEEWKKALFILHESSKQLEGAVKFGKWKFKLIETGEEILAIFPQGNNLGTMMYNQKKTGSFSSASLKETSSAFVNAKQTQNPIRQFASIAGVYDVLLFDTEGILADYSLKDPHRLNSYKLRLPPVSQIIQSISFNITGLDLWYEKGRVIVWRLDNGILFVISDLNISRSFLSIFITANLENLNNISSQQTDQSQDNQRKSKNKKEKTIQTKVENPIPVELLEKIQMQLAREIGPIAKVVISKECKKIGYLKNNFPADRLPDLIKQLPVLVDEGRREQFNNVLQEIIYDFRSQK